MTKLLSSRVFWGLILIIGGLLALLDTFNIFKGGALFGTIAFAIVGLLFLSLYITNHAHWWALIPGVILLAISAFIGTNAFIPGFSDTHLGGLIILGVLHLVFSSFI
jgi:hypothetical protein